MRQCMETRWHCWPPAATRWGCVVWLRLIEVGLVGFTTCLVAVLQEIRSADAWVCGVEVMPLQHLVEARSILMSMV